jgi:hypothetical protein
MKDHIKEFLFGAVTLALVAAVVGPLIYIYGEAFVKGVLFTVVFGIAFYTAARLLGLLVSTWYEHYQQHKPTKADIEYAEQEGLHITLPLRHRLGKWLLKKMGD